MKKMISLLVFVLGVGSLVAQKGDMKSPKFKVMPTGDTVYVVVDEMPEFPGGKEELFRYLERSVRYPIEAQKQRLDGRVITRFLVLPSGKIADVTIVKGAHPALDAEAIRVISAMPKWTPGKQDGKVKTVACIVPIIFRLQ